MDEGLQTTLPFDACTNPMAYIGKKNTTVSGIPCQSWKSQHPHVHPHIQSYLFPEDDLNHNFCRNPTYNETGPWCYTLDPEIRSESCFPPQGLMFVLDLLSFKQEKEFLFLFF